MLNTIVPCHSETIQRAITFLHAIQRPEGGWVGSWGICFTYATMFALESLSLVGETYETSKYARRACDFLVSKQRADGGWGESYKVRPTLHVTLLEIYLKFWDRHARPACGLSMRTPRSYKRHGQRWPSCTRSIHIRRRLQRL